MWSWMEFSERCFQWWQHTMTRYADALKEDSALQRQWGTAMEQALRAKQHWDRWLEETWRWWQLPAREDLTRLGERFNVLEDHLMDLQAQMKAQGESLKDVERDKKDAEAGLEGLTRAVKELRDAIPNLPEEKADTDAIEAIGSGLTRVEQEMRQLRETITNLGQRLNEVETGTVDSA